MSMDPIGLKIAAYEDLRARADAMKAELEALTRERDVAEAEVIGAILDAQERSGVDGLHVSHDGRNYSVTVKHYYTIPKAHRDMAFEEMRNLGMGDLIQERVDDRTLTKELETVFEENGGEYPDEYTPLVQMLNDYGKTTLRRVKA